MNRFSLFLLLVVVSLSQLLAQTVEREKLLTAYTYSLAKNIVWPVDKAEYRFRVISNNDKLIEEFRLLERTKKLNGKPIVVSFSNSPIVPQGTDVVFIGAEFNPAVRSILNQVTDSPVLTITDGFADERFIMINFIQSESQRLSFEINRANIINQELEILDDIVLLGGNEVDVAQLYRKAQDSIKLMEQRVSGLENRFDSLSRRVNDAMRTINDQNRTISDQTNEIASKQAVVNSQKMTLDSLAKQFDESENRLDSLIDYLGKIRTEVVGLEDEVKRQQVEVSKGNETLAEQDQLIAVRDQEIARREARLEEMTTRVDSQQNTLGMLISFSVILVIFSILTFTAYRARKSDAKKLANQKQKLENTLSELRDAQSQLVQSEKMASLGVLTAGIAHEINNATNYVYSGIYILKERLEDIKSLIDKVDHLDGKKDFKAKIEELKAEKKAIGYSETKAVLDSMIHSIQVGAERTADIVKGLKMFSRSEAENLAEVDIHEDIEIALLLLESRHKNIIEIVRKFDDGMPVVEGYAGQLSQAFLNIIGNAIDALKGAKKPKITIRTKQRKNFVEVTIKDNGPGVPKEIQDRIFDPFFTTKMIGVGTGLGLSITFGIIEKHQGKIDLKSSEKGAEFTIKLPVKKIDV